MISLCVRDAFFMISHLYCSAVILLWLSVTIASRCVVQLVPVNLLAQPAFLPALSAFLNFSAFLTPTVFQLPPQHSSSSRRCFLGFFLKWMLVFCLPVPLWVARVEQLASPGAVLWWILAWPGCLTKLYHRCQLPQRLKGAVMTFFKGSTQVLKYQDSRGSLNYQ